MDTPKKPRHFVLAALISGLLAPLPAILAVTLIDGSSLLSPWVVAVYAFIFSVPISLAVALTFGILLAFLLKRAGDTRLLTYALVGLAATSVAFVVWALFMWGDDNFRAFKLDQYAMLLPVMVAGGIALPLIFWAARFLGRAKPDASHSVISKPRMLSLAVTAACVLFVIGAELLLSSIPLSENQKAVDRLGTFDEPTINEQSFTFNDQAYTVALPMTADVYRLFDQQFPGSPRLAVRQAEAEPLNTSEGTSPRPALGFNGTALTLFETTKTDFDTACASYNFRMTTADICFSINPATIHLGKSSRQGTSFDGFVQTRNGLYRFQSLNNSYIDDGEFTERSARGHSVHITVLRAIGEAP